MRRIILLVTVLFIGFGLSGCDLLTPDIIEQVSEDLCREDPTNALCDITDLTTVTEAAAQQLVLDAVDTVYQGNPELCDAVFSVTNTALLDSCKDGSLLPADVASFTVLGYEQVGNTYVFQGSTSETSFLEITVTIGEVDGAMRITSFTTISIEDPTKTDTCTDECETEMVTLDDFETMFKAFIVDYLDSSVSDTTLTETYFADEFDLEFLNNRLQDQQDGLLIAYVSAIMNDDNEFTVTLNMDKDGESMTQDIKVRVMKRIDQTTPLLLSIDTGIDDDCNGTDECEVEMVTLEEFETMFTQFVVDYLDSSISDAALGDLYFADEFDTSFIENRLQDQEDGLLITYVSAIMSDDNEFVVTLTLDKDGESMTQDIKVRVMKRIDQTTPLLLAIDTGIDNDCNDTDDCKLDEFVTGEEAVNFLEQYFLDYVDSSISNDDFNDLYFDGNAEDSFFERRTMDVNEGAVYALRNIMFMEDGSYVVEYTKQVGEYITLTTQYGRIRKRPDLLMQEWDSLIEEQMSLSLIGATDFFNQFVVDYLNPDITDDTLGMTYFGDGMQDFLTSRQDDITKGLQITVNRLELTDVFGEFDVYLTLNDGQTQRDEKLKVRVMKRLDKTTPELMIIDGNGGDNDCDYIGDMCEVVTDPSIAGGYMDYFMSQFNDPQVTMEALQVYVLDYFSMFNQREEDVMNGIVWVLDTNVEPLGDDYFLFHFTADTASGIIHRDIAARLYHRGSMVYIREQFVGDDCVLTTNVCHFLTIIDDGVAVEQFVTDFLNAFVNRELSFDQINEMYFMNKAPEFLKTDYESYQGLVISYQLTSVMMSADHPGFFDVAYQISTPDMTTDYNAIISLWNVDGMMVLEYFDEMNMCHTDPYACSMMVDMYEHNIEMIIPFLETVFAALNDPTINDDIIQEMYFGWMAPESLLANRNNGQAGAVFVYQRLTAPMDPAVDPFFELVFTVQLPNQEPVTQTIRVQFMRTDMGLMIHFFKI